jgi:hypothetical protein
MEVSVPADNPLQLLLDEIDARSRIEVPVSAVQTTTQVALADAGNIQPKRRSASCSTACAASGSGECR